MRTNFEISQSIRKGGIMPSNKVILDKKTKSKNFRKRKHKKGWE